MQRIHNYDAKAAGEGESLGYSLAAVARSTEVPVRGFSKWLKANFSRTVSYISFVRLRIIEARLEELFSSIKGPLDPGFSTFQILADILHNRLDLDDFDVESNEDGDCFIEFYKAGIKYRITVSKASS